MSGNPIALRLQLNRSNDKRTKDGMGPAIESKLDASLKKNTSFIKKIRTLNADSANTILSDIHSLTLEKYLSEITTSLAEGLLKLSKNADISASLQVISALYMRFGPSVTKEIISILVETVLDKTPHEPSSKQKTALKIIFELHLIGIPCTISDCDTSKLGSTLIKSQSTPRSDSLIIPLIKQILSYKIDSGYSLSLASSFLKRFSFVFKEQKLPTELISEANLNSLRHVFVKYTERNIETLRHLHEESQKSAQSYRNASIRVGKILEEYQSGLDEARGKELHYQSNIAVCCEILDLQIPTFEEKDVAVDEEKSKDTRTDDYETSWWDDVKERDFYTNIPNYQDVVRKFDSLALPTTEYEPLSEGQRVNRFIELLGGILREEDLDLVTVIMHTYVPANKATKNRILKFFSEVRKIDTVNLYAKFLRINQDYFPDIITDLVEVLDHSFRSSIHLNTINFKSISFFIELIKFKLIPSHYVFHKIRKLTLNITASNNVDILSIFYERCGKFLLFEKEYQETTKEYLELLRVQSKSDKLSINDKLALSNMFLIIDSFTNPPKKQIQKFELTPIQDFVMQTIRKLSTPSDVQSALIILSGINFAKNVEAQRTLIDVYAEPENLGGDRFETLALILYRVSTKHLFLAGIIVDNLVESIVRGLEVNDYNQNLKRIAEVKLFVAYFNAKIFTFASLLDLIFRIVCFGHPNNFPTYNNQIQIDASDDFFRIHLICAIFKSLNFDKIKPEKIIHTGTKSLKGFLVFFQYYTYCKQLPFPKDVEFALADTYESYNKFSQKQFQRVDDLSSALRIFEEFTISTSQVSSEGDQIEAMEDGSYNAESASNLDSSEEDYEIGSDSETSDEDSDSVYSRKAEKDDFDDEEEIEDQAVSHLSNDSETEPSESSDEECSSDDEFANISVNDPKLHSTESAEMQAEVKNLDDRIQKLLFDSSSLNKSRSPLKIPAPSSLDYSSTSNSPESGKLFKFLSKSNSVREMKLPTKNRFSERISVEQAAQKANKEKIMNYINNMYDN